MQISLLLRIALKSLLYRGGAALLATIAISVSVYVLLGIEHVRHAAKASFSGTISKVDLIVGPRTSDLDLLLTTVFRLGSPSQNMSWSAYQNILSHDSVAWAIPISLGDSHRGFRVVGTEKQFFSKFHYGRSRSLAFMSGGEFTELFDVVLGSQVAKQFQYNLNDSLILAHGIAQTSFQQHDAYPFKVAGILKPTGTPVDNALYVSLKGLEAIHQAQSYSGDLTPTSLSAVMLGLKSKLSTFKFQRQIKDTQGEALSAILPGVALTQLWQVTRGMENTLRLVSIIVLGSSLLGLSAVLLATLRERKYEIQVLRMLGAKPFTVLFLVEIEALAVAILGSMIGLLLLVLTLVFTSDLVITRYGIDITLSVFSLDKLLYICYVLLGTVLVSMYPAVTLFRQYRRV